MTTFFHTFADGNSNFGSFADSTGGVFTKVTIDKEIRVSSIEIGLDSSTTSGSAKPVIRHTNGTLIAEGAFKTVPTGVVTWVNLPFASDIVLSPGTYLFGAIASNDFPKIQYGGARQSGVTNGVNFTVSDGIFDKNGALTLSGNVDMKVGFSTNNSPTLTLTSPANNQTLFEGNSYKVEGTASDSDNNNVVTIKYKINNGTTYNAGSGVSDGTTPISFVKNLTYSNKRLRDGATDITGVDLAENTNHTLTVWAEDDQGGKSAEVTRTFTVVWNRPPTISGTDTNLGTISTIPTFNYSVTDPEGNTFTITEYLNGVQTKSFAGVAGQNYSITFNQDAWLRLALGVPHQVKVRATDNSGQFSERVFTFTRAETQIAFTLKNAFLCDAQPQRVLVTLDSVVPTGATQLIEVCNNAFDVTPTWEDVTSSVAAGRGHVFTNATKTAANWGINIRFTFNKGTATQPIIINGYGGAFD